MPLCYGDSACFPASSCEQYPLRMCFLLVSTSCSCAVLSVLGTRYGAPLEVYAKVIILLCSALGEQKSRVQQVH